MRSGRRPVVNVRLCAAQRGGGGGLSGKPSRKTIAGSIVPRWPWFYHSSLGCAARGARAGFAGPGSSHHEGPPVGKKGPPLVRGGAAAIGDLYATARVFIFARGRRLGRIDQDRELLQ